MKSMISKFTKMSFIAHLFFANLIIGQTSYTFTPAGATGSSGPTQAMTNSTYSNTTLNGLVTTSLGIQTWTVPATGNYLIECYGARGGSYSYTGGNGTKMSGEFTLTSGQVLKILVGQMGLCSSGAAGGGGGSFVSTISNTPMIVAGGGSGSTGSSGGLGATTTSVGNSGQSCTNAGATGYGGGSSASCGSGAGGAGGFYGDGSSTGSWGYQFGYGFVNGGAGGTSASGACHGGFGGGAGTHNNNTGGGAGGGYTGGGASYHGSGYAGGGGSSYNAGINQVNSAATNTGQGYVIITKLAGLNITQTSTISCYGLSTAALSATAVGGTSPYTYYWSTGSSATSISNLSAGIYTCTSTDANAVVFTSTFAVIQPSPLNSSVSAQTNVSCYGNTNGAASITAYGGATPYSYTWSPGGGSSSSASALAAGVYTVAIKDANNCTTNQLITITQPAAVNVVGFAINPAFCAGGTTTLVAGGAVTYTWSNGVANGAGFSPAASAVYTVYGTGVTGCIGNNTVAVTVYSLPVMSITGSQSLCVGSSITLTGNGANSYNWNTGASSQAISISPSVPTSYTVLGTNSFGCTSSATTTISVFALPTLSTTISNTLICGGSPAVLFAVGANTYTWTGGVSNGLPFYPTTSGTYTVTGAYANGCSNTAIQSLAVTTAPSITFSGNTSICQGNSTTITASGALTYTWNTGSNSSAISVSPGSTTTYSVSGANAAGCIGSAYTSVFVNTPPILTAYAANSVVCSGIPVNINVVGGAITYTWSPGNMNSSNVSVSPASNTTYTVFGTSTSGCVGSATTNISVFNSPTVAISSVSAICIGQTISMTAYGATTYTWSSGSNLISISINPSSTTVYSVTGKDNNGCTGTSVKIVIVNPLPNISALSSASISCPGYPVNITANGASTYTWLPIGGNSNLATVSPTSSTIYTVQGASTEACISTATVAVNVSQSIPLIVNGNPTICAGANATLTANGASTYNWSNLNTGSSIVVSPLLTTTYSVTGANLIGCTTMTTVMVNVIPLPVLSIISPTAVCIGSSILMVVNGASTYSWSTGATSASITVSPVATSVYTVTGMATSGCSSMLTQTLQSAQLPIITATSSNSIICTGDAVTLSANGGNNYNWDTGALGAVIVVTPTISTTYTVTGTSANNCSNTAVVSLSVSECTGISKQESSTNGILIYPNPSNGIFNITSEGDLEFTIINELGQVVVTDKLSLENNYSIQISDQPSGVYFILAKKADSVITQKLIIGR